MAGKAVRRQALINKINFLSTLRLPGKVTHYRKTNNRTDHFLLAYAALQKLKKIQYYE
jgi:hypothetical protein